MPAPDPSPAVRPLRIAVVNFSHETVTFLPNDTTIDDFTYPGSPAEGEALLGFDPDGYMGGFVAVAREHAGVELVGITSPLWPRTGSGSGWLTAETFEHFTGAMIAAIEASGPFDGAYLCVHGAMAVRDVPRPEAELARRVRAAIGAGARIAATFDPHGNEDAAFYDHADLGFTVKYYPHYDSRLQGERAARMLIRAIRGDYVPARAVIRVPILTPTVMQWTGAAPWLDLIQRALIWEARATDAYVNVFFGFPWSDVPDAGMTIVAQTNGDAALARHIADDLAGFAWRRRDRLVASAPIHRIADGVARAADAVAAGRTPVVLADHSDRSGYATWLLRAILDAGLARTLVATVTDPDAIRALREAGAKPGDEFDRAIGGRFDPSAGASVRVTGTLDRLVPMGAEHWALIRFGDGNLLVLTPYLTQIIEPDRLTALGLDLAAFDVIAIKSRVHFRRGFDDSGFAKEILLVEPEEPFLGTVRLEALPYRHLRIGDFYPYGDPALPPG